MGWIFPVARADLVISKPAVITNTPEVPEVSQLKFYKQLFISDLKF